MSSRRAVVSSRVVTPEEVRPAAIVIADGRIEAILAPDEAPAGVPTDDLGDLVVAPGIVDSHVHVNEPGRTEWEGFETATRAAAAGGVTTIVDMPLNSSPVTTTVAALDAKRQAAAGKCWVDVGFFGGLVDDNREHVQPLIDAGVCGLKAFLCDSGLAEFPPASEECLRVVLPLIAARDAQLLVHAELVEPARDATPVGNYADWLAIRPGEFESRAVVLLKKLCAEFHARIHVVHLASGNLVSHFYLAKRAGLPFTVETCPHYLHFDSESLAGADVRFKCAPPIRRRDDRDRLWEGLIAGSIDMIASDHSPCPPAMKHVDDNDWQRAWGGIASLGLTLPVVWRGLRNHMVPFTRLFEWLAANPARLAGLSGRKGRLAPGFDADLCAWSPEEEWTIAAADLHFRHKISPYLGEKVRGRVRRTYVRGHVAYDDGTFPAGPIGELLRRSRI